MRFDLSHDRRNITDDDILADMNRVSLLLSTPILRQRDYKEHGKYGVRTAIRRFDSWSKAVERAGLEKSVDRNISDIQLFENLFIIWTALGRQPFYSEIEKPQSRYHVATYDRHFGSWRSALEAFVNWANSTDNNEETISGPEVTPMRRRSARQPNLRIRFRVLARDRFTCCACGVSPATKPGTILHVDHIKPWSKGGESVESNLQTLCEPCNQGKSNRVKMS